MEASSRDAIIYVIQSFEKLKTWLLLNCKFMSRAVYHFIL